MAMPPSLGQDSKQPSEEYPSPAELQTDEDGPLETQESRSWAAEGSSVGISREQPMENRKAAEKQKYYKKVVSDLSWQAKM